MKDVELDLPPNFKLAALFKYCTKSVLVNAHQAEPDIAAPTTVFQFKQFFNERKEFVFKVLDNSTLYVYDNEIKKPFHPTMMETQIRMIIHQHRRIPLTQMILMKAVLEVWIQTIWKSTSTR